MKAISINGTVKVFKNIPKYWNNTFNYDKLNESVHLLDGFKDLIKPNISHTELLGEIYLDGEIYIYNIINKSDDVLKDEYSEKIEYAFSYLYIRSLASSMNKSNFDLNFLTAQREEYQDKYDVAKGNINSGTRYDNTLSLIQQEMNDEFNESVLDNILHTIGVTPQGTHLNKMFQLIIVKFDYGRNLFDNFNKFSRHFRTKTFLWVENKEWDKLKTSLDLINVLPSSLTLQDAEEFYNQFNLI